MCASGDAGGAVATRISPAVGIFLATVRFGLNTLFLCLSTRGSNTTRSPCPCKTRMILIPRCWELQRHTQDGIGVYPAPLVSSDSSWGEARPPFRFMLSGALGRERVVPVLQRGVYLLQACSTIQGLRWTELAHPERKHSAQQSLDVF